MPSFERKAGSFISLDLGVDPLIYVFNNNNVFFYTYIDKKQYYGQREYLYE